MPMEQLLCILPGTLVLTVGRLGAREICKMYKGKGKAIPLQAFTGPEVSRR
jgi:hypothetical protein